MPTESETPSVRLRLNRLLPSVNEEIALEKLSVGGPQSAGSWLLPEIFAPLGPDTSMRLAKFGVISVRRRLNGEAVKRKKCGLKRCVQWMVALMPSVPVASTKSKRLTLPARVL